MKNKKVLIATALTWIVFLSSISYPADKVTQQSGEGGLNVYVDRGAKLDLHVESSKNIDRYVRDINENLSKCLDASIAFRKEKLEELEKLLAQLYMQKIGAPEEEAKKWAQDIIQNAPEVKKAIEKNDKVIKEYNKSLSTYVFTNVYKLFGYIFQTVDSKLTAFQELNPKAKYEKEAKFNLFSDKSKKINDYNARTLILPNENRIQIKVYTGKLREGLVLRCPSLEFAELIEGEIVQSFKIILITRPIGATIFAGPATAPALKEKRGIKNVEHYVNVMEENVLTEKFKHQFDATFLEFLQIAYTR